MKTNNDKATSENKLRNDRGRGKRKESIECKDKLKMSKGWE